MSLYKAFGLTIESPMDLPEMLPISQGAPEVAVEFGSVDVSGFAPDARSPGGWWWQSIDSDTRTLFGCHAGTYEITNGSRVTIDPESGAPPEAIRLFLLGSALGAVQVQRGRIPIHGGAVVANGRAVIITGAQGAGKSTMTSALVHNGFKYLTDDVSSIELSDKETLVHASYPQRKLVRDACVHLGFDPDTLPIVDASRDKFAIRDRDNWHTEAVPAGMLVELIPVAQGEPLRSDHIDGHDRLRLVTRSLYRMWMHLRGGNMPADEFKKILTVASALDTRRVYVPRGIENISKYAGELAHELGMSPGKK